MPAAAAIQPFPWHTLRRVARDEARAVRALRACFPAFSVQAAERALTTVLGTRVAIRIRARARARLAPAPRGHRVGFETAEGRGFVDVDPELVLAGIGLLAGAKTLPRVARSGPLPAEVSGAAAGLIQWLGRALRVDVALSEGLPPGDVVAFEASIEIGSLRGAARLVVAVPERETPPDDDAWLIRLGAMPLGVRVVGHAGPAPAGLLARLGVGDVLIVPEAPAVRIGRRAFAAEILPSEGGRRRVRVGPPSPALAAAPPLTEDEGPMPPPNDESGATVEMAALSPRAPELAAALAELPLEVQIELGTATMTARAWSSFALGDVLVLDQRVGEPVGLRVSGKLIGRGELVEVDGSVGVRITERIG